MKITRGSGEGHDNTESKLPSIRADLIRTGSRLLRTQSSTSLCLFPLLLLRSVLLSYLQAINTFKFYFENARILNLDPEVG